MRCFIFRCAAVVTTAVMLAAAPAVVRADEPLVTVSGGGTAEFLDEEGNPTGFFSQFAIGGQITDEAGNATGEFMCMIVGVVAISGDINEGTLNDDGTVTFSGVAHGIEHTLDGPVPFDGCDFTVTLAQGGPDVGGFVYSDCVVTDDTEVVRKGHIMIDVH